MAVHALEPEPASSPRPSSPNLLDDDLRRRRPHRVPLSIHQINPIHVCGRVASSSERLADSPTQGFSPGSNTFRPILPRPNLQSGKETTKQYVQIILPHHHRGTCDFRPYGRVSALESSATRLSPHTPTHTHTHLDRRLPCRSPRRTPRRARPRAAGT